MAVAQVPEAEAAPLLERRVFGKQRCDKVSQKLVPFLQRIQCWLQKRFQSKVGSAGHQNLTLSCFHDCSGTSLQSEPD